MIDRRRLASLALSALLLAGAPACGSSSGSDDAAGEGTDTTEAAPVDEGGTDEAEPADEGTADEEAGSEADCEATADSGTLSGDSVVLFSADQSEVSETDLTDDAIATVAADGSSMDPVELQVEAGAIFGFQNAEGGSLDAVIVGCAGGQTMVPGAPIGFVITEPGTYVVSLDIAGTELGTVVVS
jgi:hypothetical protein